MRAALGVLIIILVTMLLALATHFIRLPYDNELSIQKLNIQLTTVEEHITELTKAFRLLSKTQEAHSQLTLDIGNFVTKGGHDARDKTPEYEEIRPND